MNTSDSHFYADALLTLEKRCVQCFQLAEQAVCAFDTAGEANLGDQN